MYCICSNVCLNSYQFKLGGFVCLFFFLFYCKEIRFELVIIHFVFLQIWAFAIFIDLSRASLVEFV